MEEIEELKKRFIHPDSQEFNIRRVSKKYIKIFTDFANSAESGFLGDYGMAFSFLIEEALIRPSQNQMIFEVIEDHEKRISSLEGKPEGKIKVRHMLSGRKVIVPIKDKEQIGGEENGSRKV